MVRSFAYVVFVLPVVFTVVFSSLVLVGALSTFERELRMWPGDGSGGTHDSDASAAALKYDLPYANGQHTGTYHDVNSANIAGDDRIYASTNYYHESSIHHTISEAPDVVYDSVDYNIVGSIADITTGRL